MAISPPAGVNFLTTEPAEASYMLRIMTEYDLAIIGGGINGTAIARDAAGRGLRVVLIEQADLASGTSSASSKLIHGGLRYLEQGGFKLVREGLAERARLLRTAPHIIWPTRFVLPHHPGLRPAWLLRLGLYIYDLLGGAERVPGSKSLDLQSDVAGVSLQPRFKKAFEYSDCRADDARFVVLNAVDAAAHGATILTRTRLERAARANNAWQLSLSTGQTISARGLVNATGPWIEQVNATLPVKKHVHVKLVAGSHIVVPALFNHDKAYIFQNNDGRIVFAIPYQQHFTLLGTTDYPFTGDPATVAASPEEISYLCQLANNYFRQSITPADVVWHFAGIRALYDTHERSAKNLSRDYLLDVEDTGGKAPLLSVYGGKLTAARHLAEVAVTKLAPYYNMQGAWTGTAPLPGGDFAYDGLPDLINATLKQWPFLTPAHAERLARAYGTKAKDILGHATSLPDLGEYFGADLTAAEVRYLMQHEWARTPEDVLWRRSKLGLHLNALQQASLARFMETR